MGGDCLEFKKKGFGGVDRISNLPDEILVDIISLVSLNEAVSTSVLSSRWLDLWKRIPTLNLDVWILVKRIRFGFSSWEYPKQLFIEWVNSVCESHDAVSLKRLRIHGCLENSEQHAVSKWVEYAATCKRLEALELEWLCFNRRERVVLDEEVVSRVNYKGLKELSLVGFRVGGEAMKLLLENTPVLERLIIQNSTLTSDVEVRSGSLKHLDTLHCQGRRSIKVAAPNLAFLRSKSNYNLLLLENVPQLVEANLSFTKEAGGLQLFSCFSQLQTLTLYLHYPKAYLASIPQMPKLKTLKVMYAGRYEGCLVPVTRFIRASPLLVEFHLEWYRLGVDEVEVPIDIARFSHQHLKVLEISRFHYGEHIQDLVDFILKGCTALQKIIIHPRQTNRCNKHLEIKEDFHLKLPPHIQLLVKVEKYTFF